MCIIKKSLAAACAVVLIFGSSALAGVEVTPYGNAHYRLRAQHNHLTNEVLGSDESFGTLDYSNRFCWRIGWKAKVDNQLSLQFQVGNDWAATEGVTWVANNSPRARVGYQNLYVHLAFFRWDPGYMFAEAGVVPLNSNGTLDLLESSLVRSGDYGEAALNGWVDVNSSLMGLKLGVPIIKGDVKVGAELFQSVIDARTQPLGETTVTAPPANPASALVVFTLPVEAGDLKITPEVTAVLNRHFSTATESADHEVLAGLSAGYKISGGASANIALAYGANSNDNSRTDIEPLVRNSGMIFIAGGAVKAGPGSVMAEVKYSSAEDTETAGSKRDYLYTDLRYGWKLHDRVTVTPRWRTYSTLFQEDAPTVSKARINNRFELILDGAF